MDHHEENKTERFLPQQEQQQQQQHDRRIPVPVQQGMTQQTPQPQHWNSRIPQGYHTQQQQQQQPPQQAYGRPPYPGGSQPVEMASAAGVAQVAPPQQQPPPSDYPQRISYPPLQAQQQGQPHYPPVAAYPQQHYGQAPAMYHPQQQQMAMQQSLHMQQHMAQAAGPMMAPQQQVHPLPQPYVQPTVGRLPSDRPLVKLSVSLIDTYKQINKVYYEERDARRAARAAQKAQKGQGAQNNGWDDENYDYIVTSGEMFYDRYVIKERIGKGSFGQVVRAVDTKTQKDVAIKIIKSKKPFLMQAKTEIELLTHLCEKDPEDQYNVGTLRYVS